MAFILGILIGAAVVLTIIGLWFLISYDRYKQGFSDGYEVAKNTQILKWEKKKKMENE